MKSGREVSPKDCAGYVLGLIFHGRETADAVTAVQRAVRTAHPDPSVTLASVVDLSAVPRLLRAAARPILEQIYDQAAQQIPKGLDPADYVFLLPDWDGSVTRAFGVRNQDKMAAIVVIDRQGIVVGAYQGPEPGQAALALVEQALARG
ncbi:MAG: hypothetical protein NZ528_01240 [Caldilineales bacterium]|nr:hypothetical protein [Caldilineales bacterium]MDW8318565.1 hypothetical protein [Anaerolineae bacterium]